MGDMADMLNYGMFDTYDGFGGDEDNGAQICRYCGCEIWFNGPARPPINADGTRHDCRNSSLHTVNVMFRGLT